MSGIRLLWSGATTHYYGKARSTKPLFFRLPGLLQIMMMMMMLVPFQHHRNTKNGHPEVSSKLLLYKEGKYCDSLVNEACKSHNWILSTWHFFSLQDDYKCVYSTHFSYLYILLQNVETWLDRALNKPRISKVSSISWQLHLKKMTPSSLSLMIKRTMCQMGANYTPFLLLCSRSKWNNVFLTVDKFPKCKSKWKCILPPKFNQVAWQSARLGSVLCPPPPPGRKVNKPIDMMMILTPISTVGWLAVLSYANIHQFHHLKSVIME